MRMVTYEGGAGAEAGVLVEEQVIPVSALGAPARSVRGLLELLDAGGLAALGQRAAASDERLALESVRLLVPVPDPEKIICLGLNYRDHAAETGQEPPAAPLWFAKFANSLIGSGSEIVLPAAHPEYVDYEAGLAVVIGRRTHRVQADQALSHVAGAMPFNDVSARDLTLLPGDIIATGTPAGVGGPQGIFLRDGDTVEVEIDRLGTLSNPIRSE
jgi:2-keto-4-pentenoate hydratase/2-oxohepta-3-ene-1,7-dioic acid hydratase in catechol pathway